MGGVHSEERGILQQVIGSVGDTHQCVNRLSGTALVVPVLYKGMRIYAYWPLLVIVLFVAVIVGVMWILGALLGPKKRTAAKQEPFECGFEPFETPGDHIDIKYYLIAILFVIFDIDLAFLFPWAVVFRDVGALALISMLVFVGILAVAFWYVWKKGALQWE